MEKSGAASSAPRAGREGGGDEGGDSIALACRASGVGETCFRYGPKRDEENGIIADLPAGLTNVRKTWGFGLCFLHLRNVKGHVWNHKRVLRIYDIPERPAG